MQDLQTDKNTINATVVITTIDRVDDLRRAIQSALEQVPPVEVIVIFDGSTEETFTAISREFPTIRTSRSHSTMGISVQRNLGAQLSSAPIIFSIDDDAAFTSKDTIVSILKQFEHPRIGAVAIPFKDVYRERDYGLDVANDGEIYVANIYIGTAYALRKNLFLKLGGYGEVLQFQGEEDDYCARMMDAGYVIRCGSSPPIFHYVSPIRSWEKIAYLGARNAILFAFMNVPMPQLVIHMLGTTVVNLLNGQKNGHFLTTIKGLLQGYKDCFASAVRRQPISVNTYKLIRKLRKGSRMTLEQIEPFLNKPRYR